MNQFAIRVLPDLRTTPLGNLVEQHSTFAGKITGLFIGSDQAAAVSDALFDVKIDGISIYAADLSQRPKVLVGQKSATQAGLNAAFVKGALISVDLVSLNASGIGGPLTVSLTLDDLAAGPAGVQGAAGQGFTFRGSYSAATAYLAYDVVSYRGAAFLALAGSTAIKPTDDAAKWAVFTGNSLTARQMVLDFYRGALGRDPDAGEWAAGISSLENQCAQFQALGVRDAARALGDLVFGSAAYTALGHSDNQFVLDLYLAYMGRVGDQAGVTLWQNNLAAGGTRASVRAAFAASDEFLNLRVGLVCPGSLQAADAKSLQGYPIDFTTPQNLHAFLFDGGLQKWRNMPMPVVSGRGTVVFNSTALAALAEDSTHTVTLAKSYRIISLQADRACRVRLYSTAAQRAADLARPLGLDPSGDHGLIMEVVFTAAGTIRLAPQPGGSNLEAVPSANIPISVQNRSGGASAVQLTFIYLSQEG